MFSKSRNEFRTRMNAKWSHFSSLLRFFWCLFDVLEWIPSLEQFIIINEIAFLFGLIRDNSLDLQSFLFLQNKNVTFVSLRINERKSFEDNICLQMESWRNPIVSGLPHLFSQNFCRISSLMSWTSTTRQRVVC